MARLTAHAFERRTEAGASAPASDSVTLDYEGRFLRRRLLETDGGAELMVDLPETVSLEEGDVFVTAEGARILVRAAREPLMEVATDADGLARLAWHIGNRHTPAEIGAGRIRLRMDPVMADMLARLGVRPHAVVAPFSPEGGAYGTGRTHGHDHGHAHDHGHGHGHGHRHAHDHDRQGHGHGPAHGSGCACGHDHG